MKDFLNFFIFIRNYINLFFILVLFGVFNHVIAVKQAKGTGKKVVYSRNKKKRSSTHSKTKKNRVRRKQNVTQPRKSEHEKLLDALSVDDPNYQKLTGNLKDIDAEKKKIAQNLRSARRDVTKTKNDLYQVDAKLNRISQALGQTTKRLKQNRKEQINIANKLKEVTKQYKENQEKVRIRIKQIYKQSGHSALGLLITSSNIGELASKKAILERVASKDRALFNECANLKNELEASQKKQKELSEQITQLIEENKTQQERMVLVRDEKNTWLKSLLQKKDELETKHQELDAESNSIANQIREFQKEHLNNKSENPVHEGKFILPVKGRLSSKFGYRRHPILKRRKLHNGQDIAAPHGTSIYAAGDGIVISSSYRRGYGNTVLVDHGKGMTTLYAHCSQLIVSAGEHVKQGQKIAAVGTTGLSTGPHLHFEIRVHGKPVDPMRYL